MILDGWPPPAPTGTKPGLQAGSTQCGRSAVMAARHPPKVKVAGSRPVVRSVSQCGCSSVGQSAALPTLRSPVQSRSTARRGIETRAGHPAACIPHGRCARRRIKGPGPSEQLALVAECRRAGLRNLWPGRVVRVRIPPGVRTKLTGQWLPRPGRPAPTISRRVER